MPENCNPAECPMETRIAALEEANRQHGSTHREIFGRLNSLEKENAVQNAHYASIEKMFEKMDKKNDELVATVGAIEKSVSEQLQTVSELNERGKKNQARLDELEKKPGKRWEGIVDKLIWLVVGAVAAFLLSKVGL